MYNWQACKANYKINIIIAYFKTNRHLMIYVVLHCTDMGSESHLSLTFFHACIVQARWTPFLKNDNNNNNHHHHLRDLTEEMTCTLPIVRNASTVSSFPFHVLPRRISVLTYLHAYVRTWADKGKMPLWVGKEGFTM